MEECNLSFEEVREVERLLISEKERIENTCMVLKDTISSCDDCNVISTYKDILNSFNSRIAVINSIIKKIS